MLWCLLGLFDVFLFTVRHWRYWLARLACARRSRRSLMSPSSELRGTRRFHVVRCAAKIGHANCADHRQELAREVPISERQQGWW
jgi:hypothetical protein